MNVEGKATELGNEKTIFLLGDEKPDKRHCHHLEDERLSEVPLSVHVFEYTLYLFGINNEECLRELQREQSLTG